MTHALINRNGVWRPRSSCKMLMMTELVGFNAGGANAIAIVDHGGAGSATDTVTYSFNPGITFSGNGHLVVFAHAIATASRSVSGVTANSGAVTLSLLTGTDTTGQAPSAMYIGAITGDVTEVSITFSATVVTVFGYAWGISGAAGTLHAAGKSTADPFTASLDIPAGGAAFGGAGINTTASYTATNLTENYDAQTESRGFTAASAVFAAAQVALALTLDQSADTAIKSSCFASLGPAT